MSLPIKNHRASGRVTLSDVARAAGVSPSTVSRALRGERAVDPALIERVVAVSDKLGYVPDPAARALASQRSNHVAILIPLLSNTLFVDLLDAAQKTLRAAGYQTLMGVTHYDSSEEEQLLREQLLHRPAGLLITGLDQNLATQKLMARSQVPCVHLMDLPATADSKTPYCVGFRQIEAGASLTKMLLQQGRRRIAFAAAQLDPRVMQRLYGWRSALQEANLYDPTTEWLNPAASSLALGGIMFEQIMQQRPAVDAIFFCNDDLAQGALLAALRLGIAVPRQVAIAGFNDLTGSDQMLPPLTTVRTPRARIGESAAHMLLTLMRGETPEKPLVDLGFEIIQRQSS
ncbi:LacI family DNA-binding transcriptional regulator [Rhodoferax sp.]|uniref:LacI family DNA-binding transcriptional regulator n=1 Tax=Rhodoferax sp. TaxID=50421 RepID=UPI002731AF49|nr:LacI family DNA-binding transcriptional regulator [Rhodoferax sp.]MDP1530706.1 LacI family DNA-binding transcriptional regulator [Rhodoferax sp.]MDP1944768.1 LacI family DNA-binding transcriptional regulator [Rhodoferax sp.]MDP2443630.1 LacI family DNA-binding transcriptional regulator [Rhodoferax sp.]MDZ4208368.1 LacI family DNA-binding transcriptional regulator [Rhodoferax sp.]